MVTIAQTTRPEQVQVARELMLELTSWAFTLDADSIQAPTFDGLEHELATLPGVFGPPTGALLVATHAGEAAGCVALKQIDSTTAELKRMYVRSRFRGSGIGKQLVSAVVAIARTLGYTRIILDSHISMSGAHALYSDAGFQFVDAPADYPEALKAVVVFMELSLP